MTSKPGRLTSRRSWCGSGLVELAFRPASRSQLPSASRLHRLLKKSLVECFEGAQLQLRRCKSFAFVITRRPSGRRGICFSTFSAALQRGTNGGYAGSCQPPMSAASSRESAGPQVPGSYNSVGQQSPRIGSTIAHAASTASCRTKSRGSPFIASVSKR